jgi:hypothetical protein
MAGFALTSCSTAAAKVSSAPAHRPSVVTVTTATTIPPTTTTTTEQPGWIPVSTVGGAIAVDSRSIAEPDGHSVTLFRFRTGRTKFALHVGTTDPPIAPSMVGPDDGGTIGPEEAGSLLAAFNGGFKVDAGAGGFELDSQAVVPLQTGVASLIIDANGSAHVGIWGQGWPATGEHVASVRQNLAPLVTDGQTSPEIGNLSVWGSTLGGSAAVARSSVGEDAIGNLVYAAGMDVYPTDLADALIAVNVQTAMELDINPEWVQLDVAGSPGQALSAGVPGQQRPASQYETGWTRDFVTVLAS